MIIFITSRNHYFALSKTNQNFTIISISYQSSDFSYLTHFLSYLINDDKIHDLIAWSLKVLDCITEYELQFLNEKASLETIDCLIMTKKRYFWKVIDGIIRFEFSIWTTNKLITVTNLWVWYAVHEGPFKIK